MTRTARILLVDDEVSIQRAVAPLLRSRGYEVEVAGSGADALKAVGMRTPDLIVLDLGLPDLEGARIWAENAPDGGAIFSVAVPVEWKQEGEATT